MAHALRGVDIGARLATVHAVADIDATHVQLHDLIEAQPGFRASARPVRLDAGTIGQAIRTQREAGAPPGKIAVPAVGAGRVMALIELSGIEVDVEPKALADLLALARRTLSRLASVETTVPQMPHIHGHVLVVEDNVVQPEVTARMLQRLGCRVTPASGMLDALNTLGGTQFDMILIDLQVVGVKGEGACRLRGGGSADTPVIALTGSGWPGDAQRLRELGFDDHLCKPIRRNQMLALLSRHLRPRAPDGQRESGASARDATPPTAAETPFALDPDALARLAELDPKGESQLLARVLRAFQTSVGRLRPQAEAARLGGDLAGLRLVAHTLKSSSASIGAIHLSQLCAQIETTIRTASGENLDAQIDAFNSALDDALRAIELLLKEGAR
ncbi:MAG: response regulator [Burkholderiales bacterium]